MVKTIKIDINHIRRFLKIFITPSCWLRNHRTNRKWDKVLNEMLDNPEFSKEYSNYTIFLNDVQIWIANEYYAACHPYNGPMKNRLPKRTIVFRFFEVLEEYECSKMNKE